MFIRLCLPVAAVLGSLGLFGWSTGSLRPPPARPVLDCPPEIDLGTRWLGEVAEREFTLANRGTAELVLTEFRSSCTCSGLEVREGGGWVKPERLAVPPAGEVVARVRLIVRGRAATPVGAGVRFHTNQPDRPEAVVQVTVPYVRAGLIVYPHTLNFGTAEVGEAATQDVDVYDDSPEPGRGLTVTGVTDARVTAAVLPPSAVPPDPGRVSYGAHLGRVRVTVAGAAGPVRQTVTLSAAGRPGADVHIPVAADIGPPVTVVPDRLRWLPADAPNRLVFRSRSVAITAVAPVHLPPGVVVSWPGGVAAAPSWLAELTTADSRRPDRPARFRVTLADARVFELDVGFNPE